MGVMSAMYICGSHIPEAKRSPPTTHLTYSHPSHPKASYTTLLPKRRHPTHMATLSVKWDASVMVTLMLSWCNIDIKAYFNQCLASNRHSYIKHSKFYHGCQCKDSCNHPKMRLQMSLITKAMCKLFITKL